MIFMYIFVGFLGSCYDVRILRNLDFWKIGLSICGQGYIVVDGVYLIERWLFILYRDNGYLI